MNASIAPYNVGEDEDQPMFDQVKQRLTLLIETDCSNAVDNIADHLASIWQIKERARGGGMLRLVALVPIRDGLVASAKVQLRITPILYGVVISADVQMQGHDIVRQRYGIDPGLKGLGGATNFALPSGEYTPDDLQLQFDALVALPIALADEILNALPGAVLREAVTKIVSGEVCLDVHSDDPQLALRKDRAAPQAGTKAVTHIDFATSTDSGRKVCNKERVQTHGPESIAYQKWQDIVRIERRAHSTKAVKMLLGDGVSNHALLNHEDLFCLLSAFYIAAGEACCDRKDHFVRASRSQRTIVDLMIGLMPLIRILLREAAEGGYKPREEAASTAGRMLLDLLTSGICHAVGTPKGTQVRQVLEDLAAPGGPLTRGDHPTIFCLSVDFACVLRSEAG